MNKDAMFVFYNKNWMSLNGSYKSNRRSPLFSAILSSVYYEQKDFDSFYRNVY